MAGPRRLVAPPTFVDRSYGLLSVVQARYDEPDAHWRNGVTWQDICLTSRASTTLDPFCVTGAPPQPKVDNIDVVTFGATPFTVYAEVDCSPVGYTQEEQRARAIDALTRLEPYQVERTFWTGAATVTGAAVYPHLAENEAVFEGSGSMQITLQCAATPISGSVPLDIVEGLGRLESGLAGCFDGQGTIHVPTILGADLNNRHLVKVEGAQMKTNTGHLVALGGGYPGTGPDGSRPETFNFREMFDRAENTLKTIVERTYVLGHSCCCTLAVPISVGGDITGQPLSPF
jgi:hypothetical protein